jgi:hypothetical protein
MSLVSVTVQHGRTKEEAARGLETAVREVSTKSAERDRVKLDGVGFSLEMSVDNQAVHVTCDIPFAGRLLGSPVASQIKAIVERTFQKRLP